MNISELVFAAVRDGGYEYAKDLYENWGEYFADEINDSESKYYNSLNEHGYPKREDFQDQLELQIQHKYYSEPIDLMEEIGITQEDYIDYLEENDWIEVLWEGTERFIHETFGDDEPE